MRPGWYILNYHSVDWEDPLPTRALGSTTRPDVFRHHLETLARKARIVSVPEGQALLDSGASIDEPLVSIWFDDGLSGVVDYALPICQDLGVLPAMSICSRFVRREEMFWRAKLGYLVQSDGLRFVRARLRKSFDSVPFRIRSWTLTNFSPELVHILDELYEQYSTNVFRKDAFRIFSTEARLRELSDAGWTITNHSAGHWALSPTLGWDTVEKEFDECEALVRTFNPDNRYWVIPFAVGSEHYREQLMARATVVEVGERRNTAESWRETGRIFRFDASQTRDPVPV